jgi:hypothetical protein
VHSEWNIHEKRFNNDRKCSHKNGKTASFTRIRRRPKRLFLTCSGLNVTVESGGGLLGALDVRICAMRTEIIVKVTAAERDRLKAIVGFSLTASARSSSRTTLSSRPKCETSSRRPLCRPAGPRRCSFRR